MTARTNTVRRKVAFGDCDPARIVYYPNYFVWFDQATQGFFDTVGLPLQKMEKNLGVLCPIVDAQSRFVSVARWGDEIDIVSEITRWGTSSFTVTHRVIHAGTAELVAEGTEVRVCVRRDSKNPEEIKACDVPEEFRTAFEV